MELLKSRFLQFMSEPSSGPLLQSFVDQETETKPSPFQISLTAPIELKLEDAPPSGASDVDGKSAKPHRLDASAGATPAADARPSTPPAAGAFELPAAVMRTPGTPETKKTLAVRPSTPEAPGRLASPKPDVSRLASPPRSPLRRVGTGTRSPLLRGPPIGKFYFPGGVPQSPTTEKKHTSLIAEAFKGSQGLTKENFGRVTVEICGFSSYCNASLFEKVLQHASTAPDSKNSSLIEAAMSGIGEVSGSSGAGSAPAALPKAADGQPLVTEAMFLRYWIAELARHDPVTRLFRMLKSSNNNFLIRDDFRLIVQEIVNRHPGLEFLESHPDFQLKYAQTVIARIFYTVNKTGNEQLTLRELKTSNLFKMLQLLDEEEDINKINDFFSYEHFYVIYCKFWELDTDHDGLVDATDLMRYDDCALTGKIVERICSGAGRRLLSGVKGKLSYYDFLGKPEPAHALDGSTTFGLDFVVVCQCSLISEVDKSTDVSIEYWFRCVDLDGDGVIAAYEIEHFFKEQQPRMQALSQEQIRFADVLCQLVDMIKPAVTGTFTKKDMRGNPMAGLFFNTLFNLQRYIAFESRDPVRLQAIHAHPEYSDWDRYAIAGYYRLSDVDVGSTGGGGGGGAAASAGAAAETKGAAVSADDDGDARRALDFSGSAGGSGGGAGGGGPDRDHEMLLASDSDEEMDDAAPSSGGGAAGALTRSDSSSQLLAAAGASAQKAGTGAASSSGAAGASGTGAAGKKLSA